MPETKILHAKADIKWLLRQSADGIEDAEALLPRFRRGDNRAAPKLTPEWDAACHHIETLADLRDEGALSAAQEQQLRQLKRRVEKLRPDLERHGLLEPRLDWSRTEDVVLVNNPGHNSYSTS